MRARNIKPGFYKNEDLAECSIAARFLAPGLWMMADREGRLEDRPKRIKGEIFPYDEINIEILLDELVRAKHIIRYTHDEKRFIQITKFTDHQRPHSNEIQSIIPEYSGNSADLSTKVESTSSKTQSASSLFTDTLTTDSLNPSSLNALPTGRVTRAKKSEVFSSVEFEAAWEIYPLNAASKAESLKSYNRALKEGASHENIIGNITPYREYLERTDTPAAHFTTWINQKRWEIDYAKLSGATSRGQSGKKSSNLDRALAGLYRAGNRSFDAEPVEPGGGSRQAVIVQAIPKGGT